MFDNEICSIGGMRYKSSYNERVSTLIENGIVRNNRGLENKINKQGYHNLFSLDELQREVVELMIDVYNTVPYIPEILNTDLLNGRVIDKVYLFWLLYVFTQPGATNMEYEIREIRKDENCYGLPVIMIEYYKRHNRQTGTNDEFVLKANSELSSLYETFKNNFVPFFGEIPVGKDYEPSRVYMGYWCVRNDRLDCLKSGENVPFFAKVIEQLFPIQTNEMEEYRRSLLAKLIKP